MPPAIVLSFSSQVAYGHVGNSAIIAALHSTDCTVIDIPTIILSSHPGHGPAATIEVPAEKIDEFVDTLADQGRLDNVEAIISGYFCTPRQIASVRKAVELVKSKNPAARYFCDPVIGDDITGIYVPQSVAQAIKIDLIPISDFILPNMFEFQYLLGHKVTDLHHCIDQARKNFNARVLITSVPVDDPTHHGNLLVLPDQAWLCTGRHLDNVPHGTGDLFTGLFAGNYLAVHSYDMALSYASGQLNKVLKDSVAQGSDELALFQLKNIPFPPDFPAAKPV